ncbi:MAG: hypothetical protein H0V94_10220 [Actinobacteria bacterium]|nr:hypothetical protein [Actinomycetota bacterium]
MIEVDPFAAHVRNRARLDGDVTGAVSTAGRLFLLRPIRRGNEVWSSLATLFEIDLETLQVRRRPLTLRSRLGSRS